MSADFIDRFGSAAASYASYRPKYPPELFAWLARQTTDRTLAWDCGTGNGQAAVGLARHFDQVIATDPSLGQLVHAERGTHVHYAATLAEVAAIRSESVSLVTVAQALHWFRRDDFYGEVARVLRPRGGLAVWTYGLLQIDPPIDATLSHFYTDTLGSYWPPDRTLVDTGYAGLALPFAEQVVPRFTMATEWDLAQLIGYLSTWSAVVRYRAARKEDPLPPLVARLEPVWGADARRRRIEWPLTVRFAVAP